MMRTFTLLLASLVMVTAFSCLNPCRKVQRTNQKLIASKHDYGKAKETKIYKRKQRY